MWSPSTLSRNTSTARDDMSSPSSISIPASGSPSPLLRMRPKRHLTSSPSASRSFRSLSPSSSPTMAQSSRSTSVLRFSISISPTITLVPRHPNRMLIPNDSTVRYKKSSPTIIATTSGWISSRSIENFLPGSSGTTANGCISPSATSSHRFSSCYR